ncbi:MAG: Uma2 family endonuclease [Chloroflexia bacterium]|nr:Uma2 family endonuclease [Chloroflexia bacterium]
MAISTRKLTYDDLESIPQDREGDRHELIDGELVVTPAPIPIHQFISINFEFGLVQHVRANNLGKVAHAPIDIRLTPENVLNPDIIFIARDRLHVVGPKTVDAPPDLVVEILSPGTRRRDLTVKRDLYAQFGVQEYWIVDPAARSVEVLERVGNSFTPVPLLDDNTIQSRVLPELGLTLETVFEDL